MSISNIWKNKTIQYKKIYKPWFYHVPVTTKQFLISTPWDQGTAWLTLGKLQAWLATQAKSSNAKIWTLGIFQDLSHGWSFSN